MSEIIKTPNIIKETSNGAMYFSIQDEMLTHREIECIGEITPETVNSLISQIRYLARLDAEKEITIYINSPGGQVSSGLALYDVMQAVPCPIRTVCMGTAASMGAILFAAGSQRDILPHGKVMIHDPLMTNCPGGSALQLKSISESLMRTREITGQILAELTHHTLDEIFVKTAEDTYFYAEEAVAFGLADRIITTI